MLERNQFKLNLVTPYNPNSHALYVGEQQYGETIPTADNYIIGSHAFTYCILVALYHPKRSSMTHLNVHTNYNEVLPSLWKEYTKSLDGNASLIKVCIMGGMDMHSSTFAEAICNFFEAKGCQMNRELLYTEKYSVFAINSQNGDIIGSNQSLEYERTTNTLYKQLRQLEDAVSEDIPNFVTKIISDGKFIKELSIKNVLSQKDEEPPLNSSSTHGYNAVFHQNNNESYLSSAASDTVKENFESLYKLQ